MEKNLQQFIDGHAAIVKPLLTEIHSVHWHYDTTGDKSVIERKELLEKKYMELYSDRQANDRLQSLTTASISDPLLLRQAVLLQDKFRLNQNLENKERIIHLQTQITTSYNSFRAKINGKSYNDNQLRQILEGETDNTLRQKAWEASKQIGREVAEAIIELVRLRNDNARHSGYPDYYSMALSCKEMDEAKLFATLNSLKELTDGAFANLKRDFDAHLAARFHLEPENLYPWHYGDPFFQTPPAHASVNINHFFSNADIEKLTQRTFVGCGMEIEDILAQSDLYPKENKCQHAYCTMIDPTCKDIRVLCNVNNTEQWASVMLHEFGHGVYDKYIDANLPYLLQGPAHTLATEAIAMLLDPLTKNSGWLVDIANAPVDEVKAITDKLTWQKTATHLVFLRWGLTMVYFERELYRDPEQDLNCLWWDQVEKFQLLRRPPDRNQPDWAAKIHIALAPVYYQNYLYGQMVAAQLARYISGHVGNGKLYANPDLGPYLIEHYFRPGRRFLWNELLEKATGEALNPENYARSLDIFRSQN